MSEAPEYWMAEMETQNTKSRGFGNTPEEALSSLLTTWREKFAPMEGADPDYPADLREEIGIEPFRVGAGYVIGTTDVLWHKGSLRGDNPRFDDLFEAAPSRSRRR